MRIDPRESLGSVPVLALRDALRALAGGEWTTNSLSRSLHQDHESTTALISLLEERGWVERTSLACDSEARSQWRLTTLGNAFSIAKASRPISRSTADRLVRELLERVKAVNENPALAVLVKVVVVFGSYLGDSSRLGDVDAVIELAPRFRGKKWERARLARIEAAEDAGRTFRTMVDRLSWPWTEVLLMLKGRSSGLSLHYSSDGVLKRTAFRVLFGDPSWQPTEDSDT